MLPFHGKINVEKCLCYMRGMLLHQLVGLGLCSNNLNSSDLPKIEGLKERYNHCAYPHVVKHGGKCKFSQFHVLHFIDRSGCTLGCIPVSNVN